MAESTPKRELPARERRASFKVLESSPTSSSTAIPKISPPRAPMPVPTSADEPPRVKRKYTKRVPLLHKSFDRRTSTPLSEDSAPAHLPYSEPLPTSSTKPESNLNLQQYLSIAESAVLAASLQRSRMQWLCDGVFKRYWTKPSAKKKHAGEIPSDNPDLKSMQRLGSCQITIEPHTFHANIFTVREAQLPPMLPIYRPSSAYPSNSPAVAPPAPVSTPAQLPPPQMPRPKMSSAPTTNVGPRHGDVKSAPKNQDQDQAMNVFGSGSALQQDVKPVALPKEQPIIPPPKSTPKPDPVIQKLAARAAADPNLKELMKIVATSQANTAQLKEFQAHIDDLNALIKQEAEQERQKTAASISSSKAREAEVARSNPSPATTSVFPASQTATHGPLAYQATTSKPLSSGGVAPHYAFYPPQPPPPPPRAEPFIKHIVLELTSPASASQPASLDRWLFPEYAVLDSPHSGRGLEMICSFLVEKRGSEIDGYRNPQATPLQRDTSWKADAEYYQPVTMVLNAPQQRILQTIARAAKPLGEVQKHMEGILETKTRAPTEHLMLQLPRPGDEDDVQMPDFEDSAIDMAEDDELKEYYGMG